MFVCIKLRRKASRMVNMKWIFVNVVSNSLLLLQGANKTNASLEMRISKRHFKGVAISSGEIHHVM